MVTSASTLEDTFPSSYTTVHNLMTLVVGSKDRLSEFLLHLFADPMHITEILLSRQITTHHPATMDPSSEPERELNNSNWTLSNLCCVQNDDLGEQFVPSVCYRDQVSVSLGGCSRTGTQLAGILSPCLTWLIFLPSSDLGTKATSCRAVDLPADQYSYFPVSIEHLAIELYAPPIAGSWEFGSCMARNN